MLNKIIFLALLLGIFFNEGCAPSQYLVLRSKCADGGPDNLICKEVHVVK